MVDRRQIIILSDHADAHIPFVRRHIKHECIVISPKDLIQGKTLSLAISGELTTVTFGNTVLADVHGVWYRKPLAVEPELLRVPKDLQQYCASALERQYTMLLGAFPDAVWISDYYAGLRASNKFLQLQVAHQLGFAIPKTLFSGDSADAETFVEHNKPVITKRLATTLPRVKGRQTVFMTTRITDAHKPDMQNLNLAPAIFQSAIKVKHDIRVTVVGDAVFPAYIKSDERLVPQPVRDARSGQLDGSLTITAVRDFPVDIAELCVAHTKAMGLNFGALDIIEDTNGRFWFIENNAGGQWAYIEQATGQPIGRAIADLLQSSADR